VECFGASADRAINAWPHPANTGAIAPFPQRTMRGSPCMSSFIKRFSGTVLALTAIS